jgi:hypothetical protein
MCSAGHVASSLGLEAHLESQQVPLGMTLTRFGQGGGLLQGPFCRGRLPLRPDNHTFTHSRLRFPDLAPRATPKLRLSHSFIARLAKLYLRWNCGEASATRGCSPPAGLG